MAYNTFPTFQGTGWDIKKRQLWSTDVEVSASGAEFRTGYWTTPVYEFDLSINYLSPTDKTALEAFYLQQQGPLIPFYLNIPNDAGSPYLVRFIDDQTGGSRSTNGNNNPLEINQFMNGMYEQTGLTFRTVR